MANENRCSLDFNKTTVSHFLRPRIFVTGDNAEKRFCCRFDMYSGREVRAKIQQAIGPHQDLLTMVMRRKLQ